MGAGAGVARRPARWRAQHRARGGRPSRPGGSRRQTGATLDRTRQSDSRFQLRSSARADEPLCQYLGAARDHKRRPGVLAPRALSGTLHRRPRHAEERLRLLALVLGVRTGPDQSPHDDRQCQGAHHLRSVLPAQDRALAQGARGLGACILDGLFRQPPAGHDRSDRGLGASVGRVRDRVDEPRRHGSASLHQRHDRTAEGCRACARSRCRTSHHRPARARSASGRCFLVHG